MDQEFPKRWQQWLKPLKSMRKITGNTGIKYNHTTLCGDKVHMFPACIPLGVSQGGSWYPKYLINMDQNTYYYVQNVTKYLKQPGAVYLIPKISHNI
jgi:hypothetical protein